MCGIAGLIPGRTDEAHAGRARRALELLAHRGPDDLGWLALRGAAVQRGRAGGPDGAADALLLHRRLSILDLSEAGWQPMSTPDGRYHIAFNGEVYNYLELRRDLESEGVEFASETDTEVLLHAYARWGRGALRRLTGMFAFAVLDARERTLFLARDFFGIKPLHYATGPRGFAFASEIKAVLELAGISARANPHRVFEYLRFGLSAHGDETLFAGVHQLPAAHYMEVALDGGRVGEPVRYWGLDMGGELELSFDQAAERLRELFLDSVRLHLRSDVPVGAALSGGVDSSAIVTAMRHLEPAAEIHAFTYVAEDEALDEERWAAIAAGAAGARLHRTRPSAAELVADLDRLIQVQEEPFGSTSIYAQHRVFRLAAEAGIKVMLDGQGADELMGGYPGNAAARLASLVRQGRWGAARRFQRAASALPGRDALWLKAGQFLVPPALQALPRRAVGQQLMPGWVNAEWFAGQGVVPRVRRGNRARHVLRADLHALLTELHLPMLLRYEDRNSMAFSIESRVPFLTPAIAEFVFALPEDYLVAADGTSKAVFKRAMRGIVPDAILDRRDKIGFATPEAKWLDTLRPWIDGVLRGDAARSIPALDGSALRARWDDISAGRRRMDGNVWRQINLVRWTEGFGVAYDGAA